MVVQDTLQILAYDIGAMILAHFENNVNQDLLCLVLTEKLVAMELKIVNEAVEIIQEFALQIAILDEMLALQAILYSQKK